MSTTRGLVSVTRSVSTRRRSRSSGATMTSVGGVIVLHGGPRRLPPYPPIGAVSGHRSLQYPLVHAGSGQPLPPYPLAHAARGHPPHGGPLRPPPYPPIGAVSGHRCVAAPSERSLRRARGRRRGDA